MSSSFFAHDQGNVLYCLNLDEARRLAAAEGTSYLLWNSGRSLFNHGFCGTPSSRGAPFHLSFKIGL